MTGEDKCGQKQTEQIVTIFSLYNHLDRSFFAFFQSYMNICIFSKYVDLALGDQFIFLSWVLF